MELSKMTRLISQFIKDSDFNKVPEIGINKIYDQPLIAVASANDKLFAQLKNPDIIDKNHKNPTEWLKDAESVISYFLPFSAEIRKANKGAGLPAVEWLYGRIEGEECNKKLREFIVEEIFKRGGKAVAPALSLDFKVEHNKSNWSERHIAFIAGLGTFGLSKSLITEKGCAGRYGSIITNIELQTTIRQYEGLYDYCIMCGACISRCPVKAIHEEGKDDTVCQQFIDEEIYAKYAPRYGCGKCQTALPCEDANPNK